MESFRCSLTPFLLIIWLTCCRLYKWTSIPWQWLSLLRQTQSLVSCYGMKLHWSLIAADASHAWLVDTGLEQYILCVCVCVCVCVCECTCLLYMNVCGWLVCKQISIVEHLWLTHCYWSLLYGTILCSGRLTVLMSHGFWLSDCSLLQHVLLISTKVEYLNAV